jgi:hypothetical protein
MLLAEAYFNRHPEMVGKVSARYAAKARREEMFAEMSAKAEAHVRALVDAGKLSVGGKPVDSVVEPVEENRCWYTHHTGLSMTCKECKKPLVCGPFGHYCENKECSKHHPFDFQRCGICGAQRFACCC